MLFDQNNMAFFIITYMKTPIKIELEKGKLYGWCTCGYSKTDPLCDGSHRDNNTDLRSLKYVAEETKTAYFCTCKKSKNAPFCDGSHKE